MPKLTALLFAFAAVTVSSVALADDDGFQVTTQKDGYTVAFDDDLLGAPGVDPNAPLLRVRAQAARATLIRARTSFVQEMLKSVEAI